MSEQFPPLGLDDNLGRELKTSPLSIMDQIPISRGRTIKEPPLDHLPCSRTSLPLLTWLYTDPTDSSDTSYTPDLFRPWMVLGGAVLNQKDLGPRNRKLVRLAVTAVFDVPFIKYAHERLAVKVGLSQEQVGSATEGEIPEGLTDNEAVIYITALKLAHAKGPLDKKSWQEVEGKLGKDGAARVGHAVAWFVYNSTLLNLGAIDVPSQSADLPNVDLTVEISQLTNFVNGSQRLSSASNINDCGNEIVCNDDLHDYCRPANRSSRLTFS